MPSAAAATPVPREEEVVELLDDEPVELSMLGQTLCRVVGMLRPSTLAQVLADAEQPNPAIPNAPPTLLAIVQILMGSLQIETLDAVKRDIGPQNMQALFGLMMAQARGSAEG